MSEPVTLPHHDLNMMITIVLSHMHLPPSTSTRNRFTRQNICKFLIDSSNSQNIKEQKYCVLVFVESLHDIYIYTYIRINVVVRKNKWLHVFGQCCFLPLSLSAFAFVKQHTRFDICLGPGFGVENYLLGEAFFLVQDHAQRWDVALGELACGTFTAMCMLLVVEHFSLVKWILLLIIIIALWVFVKAVRISASLVSVSSVLVCFDFFGRKTCSVPLVSELTPWTLGACRPPTHWAEHGHAD